MTGVIPGAAVDLTSFLLDKIILWVSLLPSNLFSSFFPQPLASPFFSVLSYNYHMHSLLSLCVTVTKFHFFKIEIRCLLKWGEIFFFFLNAETSAEYFSFCCFPHKPISLGERWEWKSCCLGCWFLCILYKTYVNVSPFGLGFAFSPWF